MNCSKMYLCRRSWTTESLVPTLVINVDQFAIFIKLEIQAAGKFNLMTKSLFVNLDDDLARETLPDIIGDGGGNQRGRHGLEFAAQMGVGGINSWGSWPLKEYLLPAKEREFVFVLKPVHGIVE